MGAHEVRCQGNHPDCTGVFKLTDDQITPRMLQILASDADLMADWKRFLKLARITGEPSKPLLDLVDFSDYENDKPENYNAITKLAFCDVCYQADSKVNWKMRSSECTNTRKGTNSNCKGEFSFFKRRHHCRSCGGIFCANCAPEPTVPFSKKHLRATGIGSKKDLRMCLTCLPDEWIHLDLIWKTR